MLHEGRHVHGREVRADDPLCSFDDPLQLLLLSQGGVTVPHCDAAGEDAFNESSVGLGEGLAFKPDKVESLLGCLHCSKCVLPS